VIVYSKFRSLLSFLKTQGSFSQQWYFALQIAFVLALAVVLRFYNITSHRLLYADESLISYVGFAWMKYGAMPYRDLWSPQSYNPIVYVIYQLSYQIFGFNALAIRMVAAVPGVVSVLLIYLIGKELFSQRIGIIASFIYAVYIPFSIEFEHSYGYNHSFVNMLVLAALLVLLKGINHEKPNNTLIAFSGIFLFLALTIKPYLCPVFFVALGIIAHSYDFKMKRFLRPCLLLVVAFLSAFSLLVLYLYINGMLEPWIYCLQYGRLFSISLGEKLVRFEGYVLRTLLVHMFAIPTIIWGLAKGKRRVTYLFLLFITQTISVVSLGAFTDGNLFTVFSPLVLLSSVSITWLSDQTIYKVKSQNWTAIFPVAVLILSLLIANAFTNFGWYVNYMYSINPEVDAQISVGKAIADITHPSEKIFVTDTALAVLSQREVITVGSMKVAGFYNDLMGYDFERYIGILGHPEGIVNNDMILSALGIYKPKVIVISRHDVFGMLDEIIWTGGAEQIYQPLGPYIMRNYSLNKTIEYNEKRWEIWSYAPGNYQELNVFSNQSGIINIGNQSISFSLIFQLKDSNYTSYVQTDERLSLLINYTFPVQKHAFVRPIIEFNSSVNLIPYKAISFWIKGDNSANKLWLDLVDINGREIGIPVRDLKFLGWKSVIVEIHKFAEKGVDTAAIKQIRISIDNNSENVGSGTAVLAWFALLS